MDERKAKMRLVVLVRRLQTLLRKVESDARYYKQEIRSLYGKAMVVAEELGVDWKRGRATE